MSKKHHCKKCGAAFSTEKELKQHVKDKHTGYYYAVRFVPLTGIFLIVALIILLNVLTPGTQVGGETATVGVEEGMMAPDFTAFTLDGQKITLSDFRGKVVILWFMAVWCPSCAAVGPIIKDNQPQNAIVIVVDMWTEPVLKEAGLLNKPGTPPPEEKEDLKRFIATYGDPNWLLVLDNYGLTKLYQLRYVDTTFVIGPDGKIILRSDGPISSNLLRFALSKAV